MKSPGRGFKRVQSGWWKNLKFNKKGYLVKINKRRMGEFISDPMESPKIEWNPIIISNIDTCLKKKKKSKGKGK